MFSVVFHKDCGGNADFILLGYTRKKPDIFCRCALYMQQMLAVLLNQPFACFRKAAGSKMHYSIKTVFPLCPGFILYGEGIFIQHHHTLYLKADFLTGKASLDFNALRIGSIEFGDDILILYIRAAVKA